MSTRKTYHQFTPDPILQQDVRCLWILDETEQEYNRDPIVPDSFVEMIFNYGAPMLLEQGDGSRLELPRVYINGLQKKPLRFLSQGDAQFIAVRFYAWTVQPLFERQPNGIIGLDGRWNDLADSLGAAVRRSGHAEAVASLQQVMVDAYKRVHPDLLPVRTAGNLLYDTRGLLDMEALADRSYLSLRQLERRFKELIGMTPKSFARLIRYEAVRNRLYLHPSTPLVDLVYEFGYTDQAHLTHDFKSFTSVTPGEFAAYVRLHFDPNANGGFLQDA